MFKRLALAIAAFMLVIAAVFIAYLAVTPQITPTRLEAGGLYLPSGQSSTEGGISVSGVGKVRVKPDIATTTIGVEANMPSLADATADVNKRMTAVIEKLKNLGIAEKDIQTINYGITPIAQQPKPDVAPKISGYRVSNQIGVTIRKIDDVGKVLDAAVAAGANNIYGIAFGVDDPAKFQQQARTSAIKDAQDKAAQLAKAANVTLGKVISITEGTAAPRPVYRAAATAFEVAADAVPVEAGELEIAVSVEMRFAVQ